MRLKRLTDLWKASETQEAFFAKFPLIGAESDALVVSVTQKEPEGKTLTRLVKLTGTWSVNPKNLIVFETAKESGKSRKVILKGKWNLNKRHEIVLTQETEQLKTRQKVTREIVINGFWDLSEKHRFTYLIGGDSSAALRFRGAFQTSSILAKKGEIRYQIGTELKGRRQLQVLSFFGKWIISRDWGLEFEMETGRGRRRLSYGVERSFGPTSQVGLNLVDQKGQRLGLEVVVTKDFFGKDVQAFTRLVRNTDENRVEVGMRGAW